MRISNRELNAALELDCQINNDLESDALDREHRKDIGYDDDWDYDDYKNQDDDYPEWWFNEPVNYHDEYYPHENDN